MKKISILLMFLLAPFLGLSQNGPEKRAQRVTNKMTEVLALNKKEKAQVYIIQLDRFNQAKEIREKYAEDPDTKKEELKKVYGKMFGKLRKALGKEKVEAWKKHRKSKMRK